MIAISSLWLENSNGEVLLTQRSLKKRHDPGLWGPAAAGTLEPGETYAGSIIKEAKEEIGYTLINPQELIRLHYWRQDGTGRYAVWYKAITDMPLSHFTLQPSEVDQIRWIAKPDLLKELAAHPENFVTAQGLWPRLINGNL